MPYHYQDAEKRINEIFFTETHDKRSHLDIPALVNAQLVADDRNKDPEYFNRREGVLHVSSVSKCLRGVVHEMLGAAKDPQDADKVARKLGVFKAGNLFEDFIIEALGDRVVHRQREYSYRYKNLLLVGRSDYTIDDEGIMRIGENKSVHSDSFWYREKEGTLIAWQNQVQLQIYMWLERLLNGNEWDGVFSYISKDDCTVIGAPIKFNQRIIDEIVIPALDIISAAYEAKDPMLAPVPSLTAYSEARHQWQKNFLATYCDYHCSCAGQGWLLEAAAEVERKNKEMKMVNPFAEKKPKPVIAVVS